MAIGMTGGDQSPFGQSLGSATGSAAGGRSFGQPANASLSMAQNQSLVASSAMTSPGACVSAAQAVDKFLEVDTAFPQFHELLKTSPGYPTLSGLQDIDYPNLNDLSPTMRSMTQINSLTTIPLPSGLIEQFGHMQQNCEMGLFPEIGRAWLTIDSNIFLWAYDNASDVAYYDGLTETVLGVGLIKPKSGVFRDHIKYLLCLTTSVEILLLGVTFTTEEDSTDPNDLLLVPEPMFSLPTDNIVLNIVCGTELGRVFLGGKDGSLYEVVYQATEGWFSRKCRKVNHSNSTLSFLVPSFLSMGDEDPVSQIEVDNSRHILYTRSEKGTIDVYDLGEDGQQMARVVSRSLGSIVQQATYIARTIDPSNFKPIVNISPIDESESALVNLLAITESGVRMYFSTSTMFRPEQRPTTLTLVHIRLPPGFSASSSTQRPVRVHLGHHRRGTTVMVAAQSEEKDSLWAFSNDPFAYEQQLMELHSVISLNSRVWRMAEQIKPQLVKQLNVRINAFEKSVALEPPVLVTQDLEEPRKFVFLSSQGVHIAFKPRPMDHLRQLLLDNQGFDNEAVKGFFLLFKEIQACAIAVALACRNNSPQDRQVAEWAKLAFFRYGGEPFISSYGQPQGYNPISTPKHVSTPLSASNQPALVTFSSSPITMGQTMGNFGSPSPSFLSPAAPAVTQPQRQPSDSPVQYSFRHNGIFLYFSRIIRPIWSFPVVRTQVTNTANGSKELFSSSIPAKELFVYIEKLINLREFLVKNIQFSLNQNSSQLPMNSSLLPLGSGSGSASTAQMQERTSYYNLVQLINNCLEILGLWKVLYEHQFHTVAENLPPEYQLQLKNSIFRDIIIGGGEVCARLASALVQKYIEDNATTDAISHRLYEACPSIFKQENALQAKAHEMIMKAKGMANKNERDAVVVEALQLFKRIGGRINLRQACELLQSVNSYRNLVDLCIYAAVQRDPQNLGVHFYKNKEPNEDIQGRAAFNNRMECYQILLDCFEKLVQQSNSLIKRQTPGGQQQQPPPKGSIASQVIEQIPLTSEEAKEYADFLLTEATNSSDELLHVALYDWLYDHQQHDKLLIIKSPYLESYLKRKTSTLTENISLMGLLWMYYERNCHYRAAAEILNKLAERHSTEINLYTRVEYLSRAIVCMKSCQTPSTSESSVETKPTGEFLHELEEKMEVARIQLQLMESVSRAPDRRRAADAMSKMNTDLLDITDLYAVAQAFNLPELNLGILYTANHYDVGLIQSLWQQIVEKELKASLGHPPDTQKAMLSDMIKRLGRLYIPSDKYFPIEFIISFIESRTQKLNLESQWLAETLLSLGSPLQFLVDVYFKLFKTKQNHNMAWLRKDIQLLKVLAFLFRSYAERPSIVSRKDRGAFTNYCLDKIPECKSSLLLQSDLEAKGLQEEFSRLQTMVSHIDK